MTGQRVREVVRRLAVEEFGAQLIVEPIPGYQVLTCSRLDDPLAGIRSAREVQAVARRELLDFVNEARAAGRSWDEVGVVLDLPDGPDDEPRGEAAFVQVIERREAKPGQDFFRVPATSWRCGSCGSVVQDRGPFESHPEDNESGHASDCARQQAAVQEWRERTGWEE